MKYLFWFCLLVMVSSCTKKKYTVTLEGYIYKDCSQKPESNSKLRLFNNQLDYFNEVSTRTDSTGYFNLTLNGEGPSEIWLDADDVFYGPVSSCKIKAFVNDSSELIINKGTTTIVDTLYVSIHAYNPKLDYTSVQGELFKLSDSDFHNTAQLKINRRKLISNLYDSFATLNFLWVDDNLDAYIVWGYGINEYKSSLDHLLTKRIYASSKIKKIQLKSCLNSEPINL